MRRVADLRPRTREGWFGLALIVSMAGLAAVASRLPPPQFEPVGARLLALAVPLVLGGIGVLLVLADRGRVTPAPEPDEGRGALPSLLKPAIIFILLGVYAFAVSLGLERWAYVGASCVFAGMAGYLIASPPSVRMAILAALTGLLLSLGIAISFSTFLYVDIAR